MLSVNITVSPTLARTLSHEKYKEALNKSIEKTLTDAKDGCQKICPVDTGRLRDGHETEMKDLEGYVTEEAPYWIYVVHGTSRMAARNYPSWVMNEIMGSNKPAKYFKEALK